MGEIYCAFAKAGFVAVPINFRLTAPEIAFIVDNAGAAAIIVEDALAGAIDQIGKDMPATGDRIITIGPDRSGFATYETLIARASDAEPSACVRPDDPWCLMYTSRHDGEPEGRDPQPSRHGDAGPHDRCRIPVSSHRQRLAGDADVPCELIDLFHIVPQLRIEDHDLLATQL